MIIVWLSILFTDLEPNLLGQFFIVIKILLDFIIISLLITYILKMNLLIFRNSLKSITARFEPALASSPRFDKLPVKGKSPPIWIVPVKEEFVLFVVGATTGVKSDSGELKGTVIMMIPIITDTDNKLATILILLLLKLPI